MSISKHMCLLCGASLAAGAESCARCGAPYTEPPARDAQQLMAPGPDDDTISRPVSALAAQATPGDLSFANFPFGSGQLPLSALALPASAPTQPFDVLMDQPVAVAPAARKSPRRPLIIGVVLLIILALGSGLYLVLSSKTNTANIPSNITSPASQPLFSDGFADNSKGWSTGNGTGFSSNIANGTLIVSDANHKIIDEPLPNSDSTPATFTDFLVTTTFTIMKAERSDSIGLYLRGDEALRQGYFIDIYADNSYDIVKVFPDGRQDTYLVGPTSSSDINSPGQQNKLTIIMKGPKMVVLVNNRLIAEINDTAYAGGHIALFAQNSSSSNGISASFDNVAVFPAPGRLPG